MADTVTKKERSRIMRAVKSKDTGMERVLRKELRKKGYKFKTNVSKLAGKPDIVFKKKKAVIFLDSCFWHGCRFHCRMPATNAQYWKEKIARNKKRDREINKKYKKMGWTVLRFWEHQIKKRPQEAINKIEKALKRR